MKDERIIAMANQITNNEVGDKEANFLNEIDTSIDGVVGSIKELFVATEEYLESKKITKEHRQALNKARDIMERGVIPYMDEVNEALQPVLGILEEKV